METINELVNQLNSLNGEHAYIDRETIFPKLVVNGYKAVSFDRSGGYQLLKDISDLTIIEQKIIVNFLGNSSQKIATEENDENN